MSKRSTVATVTMTFYDDGDATYAFDVEKNIKSPTVETVKVIALAKVFGDLVVALAGSQAMGDILGYISEATKAQRADDGDDE